jgi:flagellar biosynthesis chaperone FliJ
MSRGKAINVKIATTKVIKALETKLAQLQKDKANQKINEEKFEKLQDKYNKEIAKLALAKIAKAEDLSAHTRYNGTIQVSFQLPAGTIELPDEPKKDFETYHDWQYKEMVEEIENAIRILKMTDEEVVSTSTYNAIARYL